MDGRPVGQPRRPHRSRVGSDGQDRGRGRVGGDLNQRRRIGVRVGALARGSLAPWSGVAWPPARRGRACASPRLRGRPGHFQGQTPGRAVDAEALLPVRREYTSQASPPRSTHLMCPPPRGSFNACCFRIAFRPGCRKSSTSGGGESRVPSANHACSASARPRSGAGEAARGPAEGSADAGGCDTVADGRGEPGSAPFGAALAADALKPATAATQVGAAAAVLQPAPSTGPGAHHAPHDRNSSARRSLDRSAAIRPTASEASHATAKNVSHPSPLGTKYARPGSNENKARDRQHKTAAGVRRSARESDPNGSGVIVGLAASTRARRMGEDLYRRRGDPVASNGPGRIGERGDAGGV
jgi:hypothetical protein